MSMKTFCLSILWIPVIIGAMLWGCSDNTFISKSIRIPLDASPTIYAPLQEGLRINYVTLEPETEYFEIEITDSVMIVGKPGRVIRRVNRVEQETETWYRYAKGNAVFESGSLDDPGIKIIESPYIVGHSWNRYDTSTSSTILPDDLDDNNIQDGKGGFTILGDTFKNRPDTKYSTMMIVGFESVEGMNGDVFGSCLKVAWQTGEYTTAYFWYAAGVGLVKFETVSGALSANNNHILSIITDHQVVEY